MRTAFLVALVAATAVPAHAQAIAAPRASISLNASVQAGGGTFEQQFSLTKNVEAAPVSASAPSKSVPAVDAGLALRVRGRFAVGLAVSYASKTLDGSVSAQIPHPFYYDQPRAIAGTSGLTHSETALHVSAIYVRPVSPTIDIALFGGPSVFSVRQSLVTDVAYTDTYPFDTATFASATATTASATTVGVHAGTDVTWRFGRHVGVGGLLRYSHASVTLSAGPESSTDAHAGGTLAGAGLRLWF